jgi:hypothetical protein
VAAHLLGPRCGRAGVVRSADRRKPTNSALGSVSHAASSVRVRQAVGVTDADDTIAMLLARCREDHAAWINGDPSGYVLPDDTTLMGALGAVGRGGTRTAQRQRQGNSMWKSGTGDVELIAGGVSGDVAWLVMVERAQVLFADRDDPSRWELRVTELFRRTDSSWDRFHRHADPLVDPHPLDEMLHLLRLPSTS